MAVNATRTDEQVQTVSKRRTLARMFYYLLAYKKQVVAVLTIMLVSVVITLINPLIIQQAIDVYIAGEDWHGLKRLGIVAVLLNLTLVLLVKMRMYIMAKVSNEVLLTIREELYTHIQTLSFQFFDSRPTGKILARIIGDVNSLKEVLSNSVTTLIPDFITILSVVGIMFVKNWKLAAAALSSLPLMILGVAFVQSKSHIRWQIHRKKGSNMNAFVHEDLSGMYVVQSFGAEQETKQIFEELLQEHKDSFVDAVRYADAFGPIVDFCWGLGTMVLYFFGVNMILDGMLQVGTLIAFGTYISMFWRPVMNLSNFYNQLVTNIAGAERIFEILDTKPDLTDGETACEMPEITGAVSFRHVTFSYEKEKEVLKDVSFEIEPGQTVALIGPTGAGKSTIVNLICRFYDIQHGQVCIDGRDVKSVTIESLRSQMGIMTQDVFLFSGTIRENIRYGRLEASEEEIIRAAKAVHAHEFIMKMEKGYDTELKERGAGLSAGQRQLLAFARTMLSEPKILILDEATSSIDTHTELLVQKGIEALLKGRTSFVIAHRLSTIQNADRIFRVDNGGILELNSFEEIEK
ncbi:ATP-binding cassette subfamily B protein [Faecalimonas umbilicata]|uniref:ATP-binding cassette subfamily B protein n=1 Tax=Faecalimonas umbilicata TaxID=1912855 RepID=A0A4R3JLZ1_9FIRM|nr:ABC transporter ATP-binding protein [Faecalimonas umbilicata]TCS66001.1 ATP-binding cassette subfamily B protein [Faecalimonas umbilicata]GBU05416.1 multidrug ABC transporter ATP-binding protein [Faecalimonas umbilicata]